MVAGVVVLLSAFLLFVLELATAKALLNRFGGSPMVWTTCMLVYQALLLAYPFLIEPLLSVDRQLRNHGFPTVGYEYAGLFQSLENGVFGVAFFTGSGSIAAS